MAYTNSSLVTYTKISPNKTSPRNHMIDTITIHCMAGNLSLETCGNIFARSSAQASSNYGIDSNGRIAMYVEEKDRSWCSSNAANDNRAITIEVANDGGAPDWHVSDKAMKSLINLVADICKRNGIKELKWSTNKSDRVNHINGCNMTVHRDYAAKSCPGDYLYSKHLYIAKQVNKKLGVKTITSSITNTSTYSTIQKTGLKYAKNFTGVDDSSNISKAKGRVLQHAMNLDYGKTIKEDGIIGIASKSKLGSHYVAKGEKQYMVTAAEILMYLNGIDPKGVEIPGVYGTGLVAAVKNKFGGTGTKISAANFLKLV